jgi:hypothetical protein
MNTCHKSYKTCPCTQCQYGSKKPRKRAANHAYRVKSKHAIKQWQRGKGDWECGPHGAGRWD